MGAYYMTADAFTRQLRKGNGEKQPRHISGMQVS